MVLGYSGLSANGGYGKSRTAAQALHLLATKYAHTATATTTTDADSPAHPLPVFRSGMYWITAESTATVKASIRSMAIQIPSLRIPNNKHTAKKIIHTLQS